MFNFKCSINAQYANAQCMPRETLTNSKWVGDSAFRTPHSAFVLLRLVVLSLAATCLSAGAVAQEGIHIKEGDSVSFMWTLNDGLGCRWDINGNGSVDNGTNNAYSGGMQLGTTDGSTFNGGNSRMSEGKREIEIGPWQYGNVQVSRRIYIDEKKGYCRWIDIFENNTGETFHMSLRYRSRMGSSVYEVASSRGTKDIDAKDWAFTTMYRENSSRPAVVHVIASKSSKLKPRVQWKEGSNELYYYYDLNVEPGKPVALCFFESQQGNPAKAKAYMKEFDFQAELAKVPESLQKIILNVSAPTMSLENIEIRRDTKDDLAVLRNGDELRGTITNAKFSIKTSFGAMDLPAEKVLGIVVPQEEDAHIQIILADWEILAGEIDGSVVVKPASGSEVKLTAKDFRSVSYKISASKPTECKASGSIIVLRNGQRLYLAEKPVLEFNTLHGRLKLTGEQVSSIQMDTPDGGLHRAIFRNGSVLSGLVTADKFAFKLALGATLETSLNSVARIDFAGEPVDGNSSVHIQLRNEDVLSGQLSDTAIDIQTDSGKQNIKLADVSGMDFDAENMDMMTLKLKSGTTMSGKLLARSFRLKIDQGPELSVSIGYITSMTTNAPGGTTTAPATPSEKPEVPTPSRSTIHGGPMMGPDAPKRIQSERN